MESKVNQFINVVASLLKKQNTPSFGDNIYFRDIPPKKLEKAQFLKYIFYPDAICRILQGKIGE